MSYKKGDIRTDARFVGLDERDDYRSVKSGEVYLDHSCGSWIIGGKVEIQALIEDLQAVLRGDYTENDSSD